MTRKITLDLHKRINYPLDMMTQADNASAATTADLPQRKVKKGILDVFRNLRAITSREGGLLPFASAATVLGVSKQRVHDLVKEGTLHPIDLLGKRWLSANELESFVKLQRQAGRPWKEPSIKEQWVAAFAGAKEENGPGRK
jgi:hypothetical protein